MSKKEDKDKARDAKAKQMRNAAEAQQRMTVLLSTYDSLCVKFNMVGYGALRKAIKQSIDESKLLFRFMIDPPDRVQTKFWEDEMLPDIFNAEEKGKKKSKSKNTNLVKILPLLESIRKTRYIFIQELIIWGVIVDYGEIISLAYLISRKIYQFVKLELIDCFLDLKSLRVFAPSINKCPTLRELVLDCNEFGDDGCEILSLELKKSTYLYTLSLNSCCLTKYSGVMLGEIITKSTIRELFVENNSLENEGVIALVGAIVQAMTEEMELNNLRALSATQIKVEVLPVVKLESTEASIAEESGENAPQPVKPKKKKTKQVKVNFLPSGPEICKLNLADNRMGRFGKFDNFGPVLSMQQIRKLIVIGKDLEEIDIFGNDISDIAARQILDGLMERKLNKYPQIGFKLGHILNQDMYDTISKLAPGFKKKKKKN